MYSVLQKIKNRPKKCSSDQNAIYVFWDILIGKLLLKYSALKHCNIKLASILQYAGAYEYMEKYIVKSDKLNQFERAEKEYSLNQAYSL